MNTHHDRKPPFCLFALVTLVCATSWLLLLSSTGGPHFIDHRDSGALLGPKLHSIFSRDAEAEREIGGGCDPRTAMLRVFMYDLHPEFHFGLMGWDANGTGGGVWPDIRTSIPEYPSGLMNLQHSIEYWLTLDLLSSRFPDRSSTCVAVRAEDSHDADVIFVPFFSSLSFNQHSKVKKPPQTVSTDRLLQDKLVRFLIRQEEWKRTGGRDHVVIAHHPNSMVEARVKLWPCLFILADFRRYSPNVANVEKDVLAPYKHIIETPEDDSSSFDHRPTLLYFRGAIYRKAGGYICQELFYVLKDEKDVHFAFGTYQGDGINQISHGMHSSKFCLKLLVTCLHLIVSSVP